VNEQQDISHDVKMIQRLVLRLRTGQGTAPPLRQHLAVKPTGRGLYHWFVQHREALLIAAILLVAALAHGINMFNYPTYFGDEGIYMSQAWAVVKEGRLAPYTYDYGHAPAGWFLIAAWTLLTGGFHTFGAVINSGRMLMLILQVGSTFFLYRIARILSQSVTVATLACLLFALSPYGIYIHRKVLLDNITTFWMLLSILLLVSGRFSLKRVWLSAAAFGISILSKENTGFLVPVLIYLVFLLADRSHRLFAIVSWAAIVCSLVSLYVLLAVLKGELFPSAAQLGGTSAHMSLIFSLLTKLGGTSRHVSLIYSLLWQASRQKDAGLFDLASQFWYTTKTWAQAEPLLVIVGSLCAILSALLIVRHKLIGIMGIATLSLWAFLARGSVTSDFYLAPSLPLLALNVALIAGLATDYCKKFLKRYNSTGLLVARGAQMIMVTLCLAGLVSSYTSPNIGFQNFAYGIEGTHILNFQNYAFILWNNSSRVAAQREAIDWLRANVPSCSSIVIDPYMWTDLHDISNEPGGYKLAHSYWQVALDPAIGDGVLHGDWRNIDYVVETPEFMRDNQRFRLPLVQEALAHSTVVVSFDTAEWPIVIRRVSIGRAQSGLGCPNPTGNRHQPKEGEDRTDDS
jgi:4-amino-4-deoxy-L-arabinose transferase-like glycosyltransferase